MKNIVFVFVLMCFCGNAVAQNTELAIGDPEKNGFSTERLQRIDKVIQQYIDSGWIAGAIGLVSKNSNIVYYKALGYDDKERRKSLQKDAIFRIASQTKAITSTAVMMLYEEGKLLLDDPISKYIPEFKKPNVIDKYNKADTSFTTIPAKREITIRDLLTHISGIGYAQIGNDTMNAIYYKAGVSALGLRKTKVSQNIRTIATLPLFHQPGEKWTYGLNADVLGYLVEVISGMTLNDFFQEKIFEPLGMKDTYFFLPKKKQDRLAMLYTEDSTKHVVKMNEHIQMNGDFYRDYPKSSDGFFFGGSGLVSTAYDYAIFMQMFLNEGVYNGERLLSPHSIRMMMQNQIGDLGDSRGNKFGLGFEVVTETNYPKSPLSLGTCMWGGMFGSVYLIDPKEKIAAQFVLQMYPNSHRDIAEKFRVLVYQALN